MYVVKEHVGHFHTTKLLSLAGSAGHIAQLLSFASLASQRCSCCAWGSFTTLSSAPLVAWWVPLLDDDVGAC